jgi:uncharacterized protein (DUF4415 family)
MTQPLDRRGHTPEAALNLEKGRLKLAAKANPTKPVMVRIPRDLLEWVDSRGENRSKVILEILREAKDKI